MLSNYSHCPRTNTNARKHKLTENENKNQFRVIKFKKYGKAINKKIKKIFENVHAQLLKLNIIFLFPHIIFTHAFFADSKMLKKILFS